MNDGDIVRAVASGELASPHRFVNSWYFRIRISGVGLSFRPALKEHVWRQPAIYLNQEFLDRASGLPVVWEHPEKQVLDTKEFAKRVVGTVIRAYIAGRDGIEDPENGDEVWGVARILDQEAARQMRKKRLSTSPAVLLAPGQSERQELPGGEHLLVEGEATLTDHIAIVKSGVWDKSGPPSGIDNGNGALAGNERSDDAGVPGSDGGEAMAEETKEETKEEKEKEEKEESREDRRGRDDAVTGEHLDKLLKGIDGLHKRMDAYEAELKRSRRGDDDDDRKRDDRRARRDEEDKEEEKSQAKRLEELAEEERKEGEGDKKDARRRSDDDDDRKARDDRRARDDRKARGDEEDKEEDDDDRKARGDDDDDDRKRGDDDDRKRDDRRARDDRHRDDARADALTGLKEQIDALTRTVNRPPDEQAKYAAAQSRADAVYQLFGDNKKAPPPLAGETLTAYELRLVQEMQPHSQKWKERDLGRVAMADSGAFSEIRDLVYADATAAAKAALTAPGIGLRPRRTVDENSGLRRTEYYGSTKAWMTQFMPAYQCAVKVGRERE
jgi:hypothetical protein